MPNFPSAASVSPVQFDGDATSGYIPKVSATITPAEVPETTMVLGGTTVLTSSIELVPANPNRVSLRITNSSPTTTLWLNFNDEPAIANASYLLLPQKELSYTSSSNGCWKGNVNAVVQTGSVDVFYVEEVTA